VAVDAGSITLSFQEVLDNGGALITGYELWARLHSDSDFSEVTAYDQSASFTLEEVRDGLTPGELHYFKYRAVNEIGNSLYSDEAAFFLAPKPA
jgi:hypothetical protein